MVDFVKCFGKINSTQIGCTASKDVVIYNISHCTNSIAASDSFLEAKLIVWSCKERADSVQYAVLKNFWKDGLMAMALKSLQVNDLLWYQCPSFSNPQVSSFHARAIYIQFYLLNGRKMKLKFDSHWWRTRVSSESKISSHQRCHI